jgi:hypothetical protein
MEDFEYLVQVAAKNPTLAQSTADGLFPKAYDCHKTPDQLEAARDALFAALDSPVSPGDAGPDASTDGGGHDGGGTDGGSKDAAGGDSSSGDGGPTTNGSNGDESGSCGCTTPGACTHAYDVALLLVGAASLVLARRRRR